jgi:hypothetical protein
VTSPDTFTDPAEGPPSWTGGEPDEVSCDMGHAGLRCVGASVYALICLCALGVRVNICPALYFGSCASTCSFRKWNSN